MRPKTFILVAVKVVLVTLLIVWLYSRSEVDMAGERIQVHGARGQLMAADNGPPTVVLLDAGQAQQLYDLVSQSTWGVGGSDQPRATFDIQYEGGAADRVEVTGTDKITVNGSGRSVNVQMLQAVMLAARQRRADAAAAGFAPAGPTSVGASQPD